jgi:hypothetical protein
MLRTDIPKVAACLLYTLRHGLFTFMHPHTRIIVLHITSISGCIASPVDLPSCSAYRRPGDLVLEVILLFLHEVLHCHAQHGSNECRIAVQISSLSVPSGKERQARSISQKQGATEQKNSMRGYTSSLHLICINRAQHCSRLGMALQ